MSRWTVRRLSLRNFRLHKNSDFFPGPGVNLITGYEGVGKSSLGSALELALTGRNGWADGGQALDDFISGGANTATTEVEMSNQDTGEVFTFGRNIPAQSGIREMQAGILQVLGATIPEITACLRPGGDEGNFFKLSPDKQREVLWAVLGDLSPAELQDKLNGYNPEVPRLGDWYFGKLIPDVLRLVSDHVKHIKTNLLPAVNKEVSNMEEKLREAPPHSPDAAYSEAEHAQAKTDYAAVTEELRAFEGIRNDLESWKKSKETFDTATADLVKWEEQVGKLRERLASDTERYNVAPLDTLNALRPSLIAEYNKHVEALRELKAVLSGDDGPIPCAKGKCFRSAAQDAAKKIAEHEKLQSEASGALSRVEDEIDAAEELEQSIKDIMGAIEEAELTRPNPIDPGPEPPSPPDLGGLLKKSSEMAMKLARLDSCLTAIEQARKIMAERADLQGKLSMTKTKQRHLQVLVEALGPRGARAQVMEAKVSQFLERANTHLGYKGPDGTMSGLAPSIVIEQAEWKVSGRIDSRLVPVGRMSKSQLVRMSALGIQLELSLRTGMPMVVDEVECMRISTLRRVLEFLVQTGVQVFVARVAQSQADLDPRLFDMTGVHQFVVERGTVRPLEAAAV